MKIQNRMGIERTHSSITVQHAPQNRKIEDQGHMYFEIYTTNGLARSISSPEIVKNEKLRISKEPSAHLINKPCPQFITTKILYTISKTSNSHVLLGQDTITRKKLVIKQITYKKTDKTKNNQLKNEIEILSKIKHRNIIEYYGNRPFLNTLSIYLEYFNGIELFYILQRREKKSLPTNRILHIFKELIEAVSYLHSNRICHLDIKPENILINSRDQIKLIDFGLAQRALKNGLVEAYGGSMNYASPEAMAGGIYNGFLSDAWSCGIILFIMSTGHFPGEFPIKVSPATPEKIKKLLQSLLVVAPEKRVPIQQIKWE